MFGVKEFKVFVNVGRVVDVVVVADGGVNI